MASGTHEPDQTSVFEFITRFLQRFRRKKNGKEIESGYTRDFGTVIAQEKDYVTQRRKTAVIELLATKLTELRDDLQTLDEGDRGGVRRIIAQVEEWQKIKDKLAETRDAKDDTQEQDLIERRNGLTNDVIEWLEKTVRNDGQVADIIKKHVLPASVMSNRRPIGLAFSGGGIRSASFNLGLAQALSEYGILPWVDYLSSVSGGGLIAGCMTSLLSFYEAFNTRWERFPFNPKKAVFRVDLENDKVNSEDLVATGRRELSDGHNNQLEHLRNNGNYLIPRRGWLNRDALRSIGAALIGTNYTVIIFLLALLTFSVGHYALTAAIAPGILGHIELPDPYPPPEDAQKGAVIFQHVDQDDLVLKSLESLPDKPVNYEYSVLNLLYRDYSEPSDSEGRRPIPWKPYLFSLISGLLSSVIVFCLLAYVYVYWKGRFTGRIARFIYQQFEKSWEKKAKSQGLAKQEHMDKQTLRYLIISPLLVLMFVMGVLKAIFTNSDPAPQIFWIWTPSLFILGSWLGLIIFRLVRLKYRDKFSIWSYTSFRSIFWAWHGLALYATLAFLTLAILTLPHFFVISDTLGGAIPFTAIVSGAWATFLTYTRGKEKSESNTLTKRLTLSPALRNLLLGILVLILNLSVVFLFQMGIDRTVGTWSLDTFPIVFRLLGFALLVAGIGYAIGRFVNFNYISLHYFARDRISDAYLKTEVTSNDRDVKVVRDCSYFELQNINPLGYSAPYHLIVTALNLSGTWHMKYKDRKSEHFIFSKYYCGSEITGYVETKRYRRGLTKYSRTLAISGAAAASAMGYVTFFAQAYMMTLLNIRLGLWLTNPNEHGKAWREYVSNENDEDGKRDYKEYLEKLEKRAHWYPYLGDEMRGATSERCKMVNLTDGGHTGDNGALYPLFQRRCEVIIAGDASRDRNFTFRDLFRVIHQVKTDLDIKVDIDISDLKPKQQDGQDIRYSQSHFALGKITYPADKERGLPKENGWLLYFKPAMTEESPSTLKHYAEMHKGEFPHVSTLDQFFDEEQFEAYRHLGELSVERTLGALAEVDNKDDIAEKIETVIREKGIPGLLMCANDKDTG